MVVGWTGFSDQQVRPARWVGGVREDLREVGVASRALFVSDDGAVVLGVAVLKQGGPALVRWEGNRRRVYRPPTKLGHRMAVHSKVLRRRSRGARVRAAG